jgi:hypothetical protein
MCIFICIIIFSIYIMSLTISGNGASQAVYLQQNGGVIEYSVGATPGSYTAISSGQWPVTINNTPSPGPSSILRVVATTGLTLTSGYGNTNGYLIAGSTYITFDGSGNTITLNGITSYPGFIRNGILNVNGFANVIVQNFTTAVLNSSTLADDGAWLCQTFFGHGVSGNSIAGCMNSGNITAVRAGGIVGAYAGRMGGVLTITNCVNNGGISGGSAGGIAGGAIGLITGFGTITGCTNNGAITGASAGGIAGQTAGTNSGSVTFTNCTNTGIVNASSAGGIAGSEVGSDSGSAIFTGCTNTGNISTINSGGICGGTAGVTSGVVRITNSWNSGVISGSGAGGIAGDRFGQNTNSNCIINQCYNTGNISDTNAGGIAGTNLGLTSSGGYVPVIDISNCYSIGAKTASNGGIVGAMTTTYTTNATITIANCYSYDNITPANSRIISTGYTNPTSLTACYAATAGWNDTTANANLTGDPLGVGISNKGPTWTSISANIPYLLSSYWLLTNPTQIYTPNSVSTSATTYSSVAGAYSPGIYSIQSSSQVGSTLTTNVAAIAGTSPKYYGYYNNIYTLTNTSLITGSITSSINASTGVLNFILPGPPECFLEGTKILCFENNQEIYRPVESLQKGDLVKTIYNGYMPVCMVGTTSLYNPGNDYRVANRIYKCPKEKYPTLFEDLYITGCHSILVPRMTNDEWENTKAVNGNIYVTDNHFRLIACADEKAEPFNKEGFMNIYHIALDHHDTCMNYGIYANGLLVESCSIEYLIKYSSLKILGEADCAVSENVDNVFSRHLVATY